MDFVKEDIAEKSKRLGVRPSSSIVGL
uniref:Uncharacterized protein n=1 Tax=Arundo donax TaxID=35708 RepID=A0A0A9FZS8_ARUDO